eukprot:CAMPEP_0174895870 /NCGR_PEP_ID=MMETSP0167-20121228/10184_1 /TAXON_ID=38298 /ORGANISM="Rhodella maculata, Strain CCMP736" /LENGTH=51 /DNA_ID=CAMNT_0016135293 /DNA_START=184 /DNA_END=336 /DNA_ORIENTATION=-
MRASNSARSSAVSLGATNLPGTVTATPAALPPHGAPPGIAAAACACAPGAA